MSPASGPAPSTDRRLASVEALAALSFDDRGLVPVVAQDAATGAVLMVAWADLDALSRSLESGELHFWSRSRRTIWRKGETSGNVLRLRTLHADCDGDSVLALVEPAGPACHTGETTCFGAAAAPAHPGPHGVASLWGVLEARARDRPAGSYTIRLLEDENLRVKKLGEEGAELVLALARGDREGIRAEAADVIYHLMVALLAAGVDWGGVEAELAARRR